MHDQLDSMLGTACLFGTMFDSHVEGFPLRSLIPSFAADAIAVPVWYETPYDPEVEVSLRRRFEETMRTAYASGDAAGRSYAWADSPSVGDAALGCLARVFDITVVGRPGNTPTTPRMGPLETALFESGHPILIAPPKTPAKIGDTAAIAWNRSMETGRTLSFAIPVLRRVKRTVVLAMENTSVAGPSGEQAAVYLRRHGVECEVVALSAQPSNGEAILAEADRLGADLLVKGAYTQSRLRQFIFGGATQHIIAAAEIPVFMAH
jgi:nucleotide-binding universal stress UspA family protein